MKIYLLYWKHKYGAVEYLAETLATALRENGCQATTVTMQGEEAARQVGGMVADKQADLVIAMTPDALGFTIGGRTLMEIMPCRLAIVFMDSPIYLSRRMAGLVEKLPSDTLMLFWDARQAQQARRHHDDLHSGRFITHFWPIGSMAPMPAMEDREDRAFDLTLLMNLDDQISAHFVRQDQWTGAFPDLASTAFRGAQEKIARLAMSLVPGHYDTDLVDLLSAEAGIRQPLAVHADNDLATTFDSYLKRYRRLAVCRALVQSPYARSLRVAVYGTGWERVGDFPDRWVRFNQISYQSQFSVFQQTKAVLNMDPNWTTGIHDRVLNAAACRAMSVTSQNRYSTIVMQNGTDSAQYAAAAELPGVLEDALPNWRSITERALTSITMASLWRDRCREIINFMSGHYKPAADSGPARR